MKRLLPCLLLVLAACAQLPHDLPARPVMKTPETTVTLAALTDATGQDTDRQRLPASWWRSFESADLTRLIAMAIQGAPDMAAARARLRAAEQAARLARLDAGVHYDTEASSIRQHLSKNGLFPPPMGGSTFTQTDITQDFSYTLDWWGKNRALVHAAGNELQAARDEAAAVNQVLTAAVADTYFAWAGVETQLAASRSLEAIHRRERDLLKARFELGLDSALPLIDARKNLDLDADRIHGLTYLGRSLRYQMSALIGADPDHAAGLPTPDLNVTLAPLPTRLPLDWLARRPDVAALHSRVEAAADRSDAARADFYPNLDLRMMIGLETLDLGKLLQAGSMTASIGPALHLPIFNSRTLKAKLGMREADYAEAVAAYNGTILQAARQAADAYARIASLEQRSQAQRQALRETEQTRALASQRHRLGLASPLDAFEADAAVLDQRMNGIEIQTARLRARVALYKALGGNTLLKDPVP